MKKEWFKDYRIFQLSSSLCRNSLFPYPMLLPLGSTKLLWYMYNCFIMIVLSSWDHQTTDLWWFHLCTLHIIYYFSWTKFEMTWLTSRLTKYRDDEWTKTRSSWWMRCKQSNARLTQPKPASRPAGRPAPTVTDRDFNGQRCAGHQGGHSLESAVLRELGTFVPFAALVY